MHGFKFQPVKCCFPFASPEGKYPLGYPQALEQIRLPGTALKEYPPETVDASLASPAKASTADKAYDYAIGDIIRDLRLEQNLSQSALCYGLCSKSKLSKIESKTLQPDIATEA